MSEHQHVDADDPTGAIVGTPQAGAAAGESATRGNDDPDEGGAVGTPQDESDPAPGQHDPSGSGVDSDDTAPDDPDDTGDDDELPDGDSFDRAYVEKLRRKAGDQRRRARDAEQAVDELRASLWRERVDRLGLLADPADLPVDPDALDDPDAIREAVDALLRAKPHLRSRRIRTRAGQGEGSPTGGVSLSALLRGGA